MITESTKTCNVCNVTKPITEFYFRKDRGTYANKCKRCQIDGRVIEKIDTGLKKCKHCGIEKPYDQFHTAGGGKWLQPYCKPCDAERKKQYAKENSEKVKGSKKQYYEDNKEVLAVKAKEFYAKNKEAILEYHKEYGRRNKEIISEKGKAFRRENPEHVKERSKRQRLKNYEHSLAKEREWRNNKTPEQRERDRQMRKAWAEKNKEVLAERYKERKRRNRRDWCNMKSATDITFKILKRLRGRTRWALKTKNATKMASTEELLGCSVPEFKAYFESLFTEGMTWDLFMQGQIHIDHLRPVKDFDLSDHQQQKDCFFYKNLQPLFWLHNLQKGTKSMEEWLNQSANV